jgi:hypothetical protein
LQGLVIPRIVPPFAQGLIDHPAPRLTFAHLRVECIKVPPRFGFGPKLVQRAFVRGGLCEVCQFMLVSVQIKQVRPACPPARAV